MAFETGNDSGLMSDINVTPLVDVMLVLLIIFMVTAPMIIHGVDVSLPQASTTALSADTEDRLIISVKTGQEVFINDMPVTFSFLGEKLTKIMENRRDQRVFLKADKDIPYGFVVQVMAAVKNAGVEQLGMLTQPANSSENND